MRPKKKKNQDDLMPKWLRCVKIRAGINLELELISIPIPIPELELILMELELIILGFGGIGIDPFGIGIETFRTHINQSVFNSKEFI